MKNLIFIWLVFLGLMIAPSRIQAVTTPEALDGPGFSWALIGANPPGAPTTVVTNTHDGIDSWQTGNITDNQNCGLRTTVIGPGTLSFWWRTSSEFGFDTMGVWVGIAQAYLTEPPLLEIWGIMTNQFGSNRWEQGVLPIPEGTQIIEWRYIKDSSNREGSDKGYLDEVYFRPDPPSITNQPLDALVAIGTNATFAIDYHAAGFPTSTLPKIFWQFNNITLIGATNDTLILTNVQLSQSGNYRAIITNNYGSDTSMVAVLQVYKPILLAEGLDTTGLVWSTSGDANWFALTNNLLSHDGIDVARSGVPADDFAALSFNSYLQTTITGPGTLKFWWRLIGLATDQFDLSVAGIVKTNAPPDDGTWQEEAIGLSTGAKLVKWSYFRDNFISTDDTDGGYLDQVRFIPATNAPPKILFPEYSTNGFAATIELDPFRGYTIQSSTNLTVWTNIVSFTSSDPYYQFSDTNMPNFNRRFYRIKSP